MKMPHELRSEAQRYRRLVVGITDRRAIEALNELATEYDELAGHLEREQHIRRRAYEMWEEQGQPRGLHIDHWISAEQELAEEKAAKARSAFGKKVPWLERVT